MNKFDWRMSAAETGSEEGIAGMSKRGGTCYLAYRKPWHSVVFVLHNRFCTGIFIILLSNTHGTVTDGYRLVG